MKNGTLAPRPAGIALAVASIFALAACGGGDGGNSTSQTSNVQGTVASGNAIPQAAVTATDVNGKTATATADGSGNYTLPTTGMTAPIALVATDPSGQASPMVTVLASLPAAGTNGTANVTTLTTAQAALLTSDGNAMDFVTKGAVTSLIAVNTDGVTVATKTLDTYLANLLSALGLSSSFDPVGTAFSANHTGADALIDMVSIVPEGAATYLVYKTPVASSTSSQSSTYLTLDSASTPANTPVAPAFSATALANYQSLLTYLGTLPSALQPCAAAGGTGSACSSVLDASYEDNGFKNITHFDSNLASTSLSLTGSAPFPVSVSANGDSALVGIPYALSTTQGSLGQYTLYTWVHQSSSGSWNIIGNQLPYNLSVSTRTTYRHLLDNYVDPTTGNPDASFFDAGVQIKIGSLGTTGSGANISYANVTGPGLPGAVGCNPTSTSASTPCGVWLARNGTNTSGMDLVDLPPSAALTSAPTNVSGTAEYRWSWATQPGVSFTPPTTVEYWPTSGKPVDITSLPAGATYQFTLYSSNGSVIGTYSVTNPNWPADATLAQKAFVAGDFPTLGSDVDTNFLSASGSQANLTTSAPVDFTWPLASSPLTVTGVTVQANDQDNCNINPGVSVLPGTSSVTVTASGTCTNGVTEAFWALNNAADPAFRLVQLQSRNSIGVLFYWNETVRSSASAPSAS